ncbi:MULTISPECIES: thioredoxin family protein [Gammaproteobacteria]|uniref:thioredoxin family protein n=1 Tax=Gammaproteobacteria TaxID=1236 RepID=UPI000DD09B0A|nr:MULTISPECIES: thioredoxin family protein [Gammaproteobacteria]RTE86617.1 thioredoxin family protein [Aliidiomarina sp. B3213]TCZ90828.1 thioredoxin family protein [Lysobacter sp. N42]
MSKAFKTIIAGLQALLFVTVAGISPTVSAANEADIHADFQFSQHPASMQQLHEAREAAINSSKPMLLVLGAEWCHDSQALAQAFSRPDFHQQLNQNYQVLSVDVGYLEAGYGITQTFGLPTFYGTPTVLIVDPNTSTILNKIDFQQWTSAAAKADEDYESYFIEKNFPVYQPSNINPETLQRILAFEAEQAERVMHGFQIVGPLLRQYIESDRQDRDEFLAAWNELSPFRNEIPRMLEQAIQTQSIEPLKAAAPLSWELAQ